MYANLLSVQHVHTNIYPSSFSIFLTRRTVPPSSQLPFSPWSHPFSITLSTPAHSRPLMVS